MADRYDHAAIERKWRERWDADGLYRVSDDDPRPKWYALTMLPYTSGDLHIGHWWAMAPSDAAARWRRMNGYNVFFPIGFDAFGLPAENAAIARGIHPYRWTMDNIVRMRGQLRTMGAMFDWDREAVSCDPAYYRWTQWFFLKLFEKGLAYRAKAPANWCSGCQTVLANEQVLNGACERCGTPVVRRDLEQWFFRITRYADELLDFSHMQWPERITTMQRNWIGRSEGAELSFALERPAESVDQVRVFTTRPDTLFGVTFMVLAPEHPLVEQITTPDRIGEVRAYVDQARRQTEIERLSTEKEKTGVFTGAYCVNRLSGERVPILIADYALLSYGTGAVMGVPAHDQRDFEFAVKYGIEIRMVIEPPGHDGSPLSEAYVGDGRMVNSGSFTGSPSEEGKKAVAEEFARRGWGGPTVSYRLRDWLISRQRYWGAPIPIVYCPDHGAVGVPEDQLPVLLPEDAEFRPTGESPLVRHEAFVHTTCPKCGKPARRETDTMDTFMDSNWYFIRYVSPQYDRGPVDPRAARHWLPVDQYTGGAEHAVMHLLYARFFWKTVRDIDGDLGISGEEPFLRLFNQGQILGPDGQRMSKSRGNVVAPDEQVAHYGADAFRAYLMFLGPWEDGGPFELSGINGIVRWLNRVWSLVTEPPAPRPTAAHPAPTSAQAKPTAAHPEPPTTSARPEPVEGAEIRRWTHRTVKKAGEDIERFRFNTMLAALMEFTNFLAKIRESGAVDRDAWDEAIRSLVLMMAPSTPHLAEELWGRIGGAYSVHQQAWPAYDAALVVEEEVTLVVQVNGKVRDRITVPATIDEARAKELALGSERVRAFVEGRPVKAVIYVPGRLVNVVAG